MQSTQGLDGAGTRALHQMKSIHHDRLNFNGFQVAGVDGADDPKGGVGHKDRVSQLSVQEFKRMGWHRGYCKACDGFVGIIRAERPILSHPR